MPLSHCCDLVGVHGHTIGGDDMAQVHHRGGAKRTLGALQMEVVHLESIEDGAQVLLVFGP
jgi:hypothetical protein